MIREEYLQRIRESLRHYVVLCHGLRGVGITTIISQFVERYSDEYHCIYVSNYEQVVQKRSLIQKGDVVIIDDCEWINNLPELITYLYEAGAKIILGAHHNFSFFSRIMSIEKPVYEIEIKPSRLSELLDKKGYTYRTRTSLLNKKCDEYVKTGGLLGVFEKNTFKEKFEYLNELFDEIILKDILPFLDGGKYFNVRSELIFLLSGCGEEFTKSKLISSMTISQVARLAEECDLIKVCKNKNRAEKELFMFIPNDIGLASCVTGLNYKLSNALKFIMMYELENRNYTLSFYSKNAYVDVAIVAEKNGTTNLIQHENDGEDVNDRRNLDYSLIYFDGDNCNRYVVCLRNVISFDNRIKCISFFDFMFSELQ